MSESLRNFVVLGLDPSLTNFGMVKLNITLDLAKNCQVKGYKLNKLVLSESPTVKNKFSHKNVEDRERAILHKNILKREIEDVDFVFCELPVGSQTARAMASYGICIGLLAWIEIPFFVVRPQEVKVAACNSPKATKKQMIEWAYSALPNANWYKNREGKLLDKNEHLADALAAIVAGVQSDSFLKAMLTVN